MGLNIYFYILITSTVFYCVMQLTMTCPTSESTSTTTSSPTTPATTSSLTTSPSPSETTSSTAWQTSPSSTTFATTSTSFTTSTTVTTTSYPTTSETTPSTTSLTTPNTTSPTTSECTTTNGTTVEYSVSGTSVRENKKTVRIALTRTKGDGDARLNYKVTGVTVSGSTAIASLPLQGNVFFNDGSYLAYITITFTDDAVKDGDEKFKIEISNPSVGTITTPTAYLTILDDE